jgi:hypothetical protein
MGVGKARRHDTLSLTLRLTSYPPSESSSCYATSPFGYDDDDNFYSCHLLATPRVLACDGAVLIILRYVCIP